jgi:Tol biopolymer transport system component
MRSLLLAGVLALGLGALFFWGRPVASSDPRLPHLTYVATAHQQGIVGYRDPVGALSPDGRLVAYSEGRHVRVVSVAGGLSPELPAADGQVRWIAWSGARRVVVEDTGGRVRWWAYDLDARTRQPLIGVPEIPASGGDAPRVRANDLRQIAMSADGAWIAAVAATKEGAALWRVAVDGSRAERLPSSGRPATPVWSARGEIACVVSAEGRQRIAAPCDAAPIVPTPDVEAHGPLALSPDGGTVYFASPNENGMVDLWSLDRQSRRATRLSWFSRDTYAPSVAADGTLLFKTQSYRTHVAELAPAGVRQLTTFQAETPWWHPREPWISVTYGTWRRVVDDANYPDIAQEIGVIDANRPEPSDEPMQVVAATDSEDQAMAWSPNGRWIALHSHREMSDDIWLRPADGSRPDRRITMLGRGAEVGWPRWAPDGRTVLLDGANKQGRSVAWVIGVDQETGEVTTDLREVATPGFEGDIMHAEWLPDGRRIAAIAKEGPGRHALILVPLGGGATSVVHRIASEHDFPGSAVSADGRELAYVAPAADGRYQVFTVPVAGGTPRQITTDPSHKSQPAWSPDGSRLAFTVWSYTATFWTIKP